MESLSSLANVGLFLAAGAAIWWSGTRLERVADAVAVRTGLGRAFVGMALLATATSLPEVATTVTAVVWLDDPALAVHNLLGGVALQTAVLVVADLAQRERGALTYFAPRYALLLQGVGLVLLLQLTIAGITAGGVPAVLGVSVWSVLLLLAQGLVMFLTYRHRGQPRWTPTEADDVPEGERPRDEAPVGDRHDAQRPMVRLWGTFALHAGVVLAGGWLATRTVDVLAERTGLGSAFMGATVLALATSLPEVSTTFSAARGGRYTLAISNIFGSNAFCVALIFLADVLYREGPVLAHVERSVVFITAVGAAMTCMYLWGLVERENRTLGRRLGWDSVAALATYAGGVTVLYLMQ